MQNACHCGRANAHERIENSIASLSKRQHQPLYQFNGKLSGMVGLFRMVVLDVGNIPNLLYVGACQVNITSGLEFVAESYA